MMNGNRKLIKGICKFMYFSALLAAGCSETPDGSGIQKNDSDTIMQKEDAEAKLGTNYRINMTITEDSTTDNVTICQDGDSYMILTDDSCVIFDAVVKQEYVVSISDKQYIKTALTEEQINASKGTVQYSGLLYSQYAFSQYFESEGSAVTTGRACKKYKYTDPDDNTAYVFYIDNELGILLKEESVKNGMSAALMEITAISTGGISKEHFLDGFPENYTLVTNL
jgi:hypothetical protein